MKTTPSRAWSKSAITLARSRILTPSNYFLGRISIVMLIAILIIISLRTAVPDSILSMDISPTVFLHHIFAAWTDNDFGQRINGSGISYLPMAILYALLHVLGLS